MSDVSDGGLSEARLARLRQVLAGYVERGEVPGLVAVVQRRGHVHIEVHGTLAAGGGEPMRRDSIFRISSMTKPVTATAAMILVEEGRLRLDDPVDALLPELADRRVLRALDGPVEDTVPALRPITLRDLLTFRLGYGALMAPPGTYPVQQAVADTGLHIGPPDPAKDPEPDEWLRRLATLPLFHQPGERWVYHTGAEVTGVLVARAAGRPLEEFMHERIFEPLGMRDTSFSVPAAKLDRFTTSYLSNPADGALIPYDPPADGSWSRPPAFPGGGAGLVSTADDYLAFSQMLLGLGRYAGRRVLSRPAVELMTTDQLTPAQKNASGLFPGQFDDFGWGFGMGVTTVRTDLARSVGSFGWDGGLGTCWTADPREELTLLLLTQRAWASPEPPELVRDFRTLAYQAIDD
ncbi:serine hydrolase [Kitasatospora sp. MBT63]|uniref:serine hydrolase domain-containing protein n=1 Tax=Kitasatospora sp. MBT63 TaxID=1444768 RepID=UPI0005396CB4|nr:serine hydrolase domain-containing protein [Kitasatospora sp. MBT63]